jgi:hypothetical protein
MNREHRRLSLAAAAKIIYANPRPTVEQIERVQARLEAGVLKGSRVGLLGRSWETTTEAVAEYLARQSLHQQARSAAVSHQPSARSSEFSIQIREFYGEILKQYFLAVILRRKIRGRSVIFYRCVTGGQITCLLMLAGVVALTINAGLVPAPPEQALVARWIEQETGRFQVIQWFPPQAAPRKGRIMRVQYRYFTRNGKPIDTDRKFLVRGDSVTQLDSE